jgi:glutathione S-transferase
MPWIELVTILAILQFMVFGMLVGSARGKYKIKAPATTGHDLFERVYRIQMNTLELLISFLPALWLATRYWSPNLVAAIGAVYLVGRVLFYWGYINPSRSRTLGFVLSISPVFILLLACLVGWVRANLM